MTQYAKDYQVLVTPQTATSDSTGSTHEKMTLYILINITILVEEYCVLCTSTDHTNEIKDERSI
jgi:hypothetical protein